MQSLFAVKLFVLQGIYNVEAGNPGKYCKREQNRDQIEYRIDSQVRTNWGKGKPHPKNQVTQSGDPFGVAVEQDNEQCYDGQVKDGSVDKESSDNKEEAIDDRK